MPSDKLTELGIKKSKSGKKEKNYMTGKGSAYRPPGERTGPTQHTESSYSYFCLDVPSDGATSQTPPKKLPYS